MKTNQSKSSNFSRLYATKGNDKIRQPEYRTEGGEPKPNTFHSIKENGVKKF